MTNYFNTETEITRITRYELTKIIKILHNFASQLLTKRYRVIRHFQVHMLLWK